MKKLASVAFVVIIILAFICIDVSALPSDTEKSTDTSVISQVSSALETDTETSDLLATDSANNNTSSIVSDKNIEYVLPQIPDNAIKYPQGIVNDVKIDKNNQKIWGIVCGWLLIVAGLAVIFCIISSGGFNTKNKSKSEYNIGYKSYGKAFKRYKKRKFK